MNRSTSLLDQLVKVSSVAVLGLGVLYVVGWAARAGELSSAGLEIQYVLPLLTFDQALGRGVSIVLDPQVMFFIIVFGFSYGQLLVPDGRRTLAWRRARVDAISTRLHAARSAISDIDDASASSEVKSLNDEIKMTFERLRKNQSNHGINFCDRESRRIASKAVDLVGLHGIVSEAAESLKSMMSGVSVPSASLEKRRKGVVVMLLLIAAVASFFVFDVDSFPLAIYSIGLLLCLALFVDVDKPLFQRHIVAIVSASVLVFGVSKAYLDPKPLPEIEIVTSSVRPVAGQLIAGPGTSTGNWIVAIADRIEVFSETQIRSLEISEPRVAESKYEGRSMYDVLKSEKKSD